MSLWEYFHCNEFWNEENYQIVPLVVLDQFEEIFTLCKDSQTQTVFFEQLSDLCDNKYPQYVQEYIGNRDNRSVSYPETVNFRCVLSLREDFLARLEEQAEKIPSLKRNRFSLQCISEEQALEIIMKPQPGLVSEDVAIQIIERVTNKKYREDFTVHDQPDIIVEPSILSLFCSELDKKRKERGLDIISQDLIGAFGDNIIKDFYVNCIKGLPAHKIAFIENRLLTVDGFRDAVAVTNAKRFGFTDEEIKKLTDARLIRIEEWDGAKRMEFTHDVLCSVASTHRNEREKEEEAQRIRKEEKKKRRRTIFVTAFLSMVVFGLLLWLTYPLFDRQKDSLPQKHPCIISFVEDSLVEKNEGWSARLTVELLQNEQYDTISVSDILQRYKNEPIRLEIDSATAIRFSMKFDGNGEFIDTVITTPFKDIVEQTFVQIPISKIVHTTYTYAGNVCFELNEKKIPITKATVVLQEKVAYTDSVGNFILNLESPVDDNDEIYIIKRGFNTEIQKAVNDIEDDGSHIFLLTPKDSLAFFATKINYINEQRKAKIKTPYDTDKLITFDDGTKDRIVIVGVFIKENSLQNNRIEGYFYLKSEIDAISSQNSSEDALLFSYYYFTGIMDKSDKKNNQQYEFRGEKIYGETAKLKGVRYLDGYFGGTMDISNGKHGEFNIRR